MSANTHQTHHTLKRRHTSLRFLTRFLSVQGIGLRFPLAWHPQLLSSNPYLQLHQNNCILSSEFSNQFSVQCIQFGSPLAKSSSDLLIEGVASYDPPLEGGLAHRQIVGAPLIKCQVARTHHTLKRMLSSRRFVLSFLREAFSLDFPLISLSPVIKQQLSLTPTLKQLRTPLEVRQSILSAAWPIWLSTL
jgi:hypothetical protein